MKSLNSLWFVLGWQCVWVFNFSDAIKYNPNTPDTASNQFTDTRSGSLCPKCQKSKKDINFDLIRIPNMTQWSCCLQMCFLKRNNRKALYVLASFTINPLAFTKWDWGCQKLEDTPLSLNLKLKQAGCSYSIQPPPLKTFQLTAYICTLGITKRQKPKELGQRKITGDKIWQVCLTNGPSCLSYHFSPIVQNHRKIY